jgi:hypothetical protein
LKRDRSASYQADNPNRDGPANGILDAVIGVDAGSLQRHGIPTMRKQHDIRLLQRSTDRRSLQLQISATLAHRGAMPRQARG